METFEALEVKAVHSYWALLLSKSVSNKERRLVLRLRPPSPQRAASFFSPPVFRQSLPPVMELAKKSHSPDGGGVVSVNYWPRQKQDKRSRNPVRGEEVGFVGIRVGEKTAPVRRSCYQIQPLNSIHARKGTKKKVAIY